MWNYFIFSPFNYILLKVFSLRPFLCSYTTRLIHNRKFLIYISFTVYHYWPYEFLCGGHTIQLKLSRTKFCRYIIFPNFQLCWDHYSLYLCAPSSQLSGPPFWGVQICWLKTSTSLQWGLVKLVGFFFPDKSQNYFFWGGIFNILFFFLFCISKNRSISVITFIP